MGLTALADCFRTRREQLGLTQRQVASRLGYSQSEISEIEAMTDEKRKYPRMDLLSMLGSIYGLTPNEIARIGGWWSGSTTDNPYLELLDEVLTDLPVERREALLRQWVTMAKAERQLQQQHRVSVAQ